MSLRGDYLLIKADLFSSGVNPGFIAESTSVSVDFSAEALETTTQTSGLNASYMGGKVTGTISGDFLLASSGDNFELLFKNYMDEGASFDVEVHKSGSAWFTTDAVFTSLSLSGGNSDQLVTGSYSMNITGAITFPT